MTDQLSLFVEEAVVRPLEAERLEAGSVPREEERQALSRVGGESSLGAVGSRARTPRVTAGYETRCPVVWEDGGREPSSYPVSAPAGARGTGDLGRVSEGTKRMNPPREAWPTEVTQHQDRRVLWADDGLAITERHRLQAAASGIPRLNSTSRLSGPA